MLELPREESPVKFASSEKGAETGGETVCSVEAGDVNEVRKGAGLCGMFQIVLLSIIGVCGM